MQSYSIWPFVIGFFHSAGFQGVLIVLKLNCNYRDSLEVKGGNHPQCHSNSINIIILFHFPPSAGALFQTGKQIKDAPSPQLGPTYPRLSAPPPPKAQPGPPGCRGRSGPAHSRRRPACVTAWRLRPPPSFSVAAALTERDGGGRGSRVTGHRVGKARVLPASEEPYQSELYGAEAGRGNL